jgi:hypothetical protein
MWLSSKTACFSTRCWLRILTQTLERGERQFKYRRYVERFAKVRRTAAVESEVELELNR